MLPPLVPGPIPAPVPYFAPPPMMPAAAPGIVSAAPPPMPACAPGFPTAFGPFGSNKKNERHPIETEDKPVDTPVLVDPPAVDPNAPKLEAKRTVPVELIANSTQEAVVTEKPTV